jgi:hypothetical protein
LQGAIDCNAAADRDAKQFGDPGFEGLSADQMKKSPPRFPS